mgnify:CR=1 FL=1
MVETYTLVGNLCRAYQSEIYVVMYLCRADTPKLLAEELRMAVAAPRHVWGSF